MRPTFANLIKATGATSGMTKKHTRLALESFFKHLSEAVWAAGRVSVPGLGSFRVRSRRESMTLPWSRYVHARVAGNWRSR